MLGANTTVAVIGTGRMGGAMASTIARAGHPVVVWNRDRTKAERVAAATGSTVAESPAAAASVADLVLTSMADDAAVRAVYLGDEGVAAGIAAGSIAIDTSTIAPRTVHEVGAAVDAVGAGMLDGPVSGSVSSVEAGSLLIMVGGEAALLDRIRPVLETLASRIVHVGPRGSGAATKLAVNGLVHGLNVALSEAIVLAERAGVDRTTAYEVFAGGAGGAPFVQYKRQAYLDPDATPVAFSLDLVAKDLELITGLAAEVGAPMDQAAIGLDIVRRAIAAGHGSDDLSAIAVYLREGDES